MRRCDSDTPYGLPPGTSAGSIKPIRRQPFASSQAAKVLEDAKRRSSGGGLCFPRRGGRPLAKSTFNRMHREAGIVGYSDPETLSGEGTADPHGWRSTFADYLMANGVCDNEVKESVLAHEVRNPTDKAYTRTRYFDRRVPVMQAYADHVAPRVVKRGLDSFFDAT